ncbi:MAG: tRNA (guanosine(46)-N7)-methyltransferase TrmB [Flavobacteriales bacterium]|nr:tRNA (guanosine(46)-N7)-methyltransferase TrmB [Flavobacteriales bacterium]
MSRSKLKKFEQLQYMSHVVQPNRDDLLNDSFLIKGNWNKQFKNSNPIVLELGCGKGEYSVALAKMFPNLNFIGIDIKGSRIHSGAKAVELEKLNNVIFIRTQIEYIESLFANNEIHEIWITFPDPQIKYNRRKKRLTHPLMLEKYHNILMQNGMIHLKTDSLFLHGYTLGVLEKNFFKVHKAISNIYENQYVDDRLLIKTHYENIFLKDSQPITYLSFSFLY